MEKPTLHYVIIGLLVINTLMLGGIFCKLVCPKSSFCPFSKKGGMMCPITGKTLKQESLPPSVAPVVPEAN